MFVMERFGVVTHTATRGDEHADEVDIDIEVYTVLRLYWLAVVKVVVSVSRLYEMRSLDGTGMVEDEEL